MIIDKWTDPYCGACQVEEMGPETPDDYVLICESTLLSDANYLDVAMRRLAQLAKEREGKILVYAAAYLPAD